MSQTDLKTLSDGLRSRLRLRSDPVALKLFESEEDLLAVPGLRRPQPGIAFSMCQLIGQVRWLGWTLGILRDNFVAGGNCGGVLGLEKPAKKYLDGSMFEGVWFENRKAARDHQKKMPRVESGRWVGVVGSPLSRGRIADPDTVLIYATPAQMILLVNALQYKDYARFKFEVTGETACADSWGRAIKTDEPSISIPCFAERRFGGVQEDELLIALPPRYLPGLVEGLDWLAGRGIRYPIPPWGPQADPSAAFAVSYGDKLSTGK